MNLYLRISAVLTLVALALMVWSLLQPTPMPVMIAMSVGQGLGTLAFATFGYVVFRDLTRKRSEAKSQRLARISQEIAIRESQKIARRISGELEAVKPDDDASTVGKGMARPAAGSDDAKAGSGDAAADDTTGDAEPAQAAADDATGDAEPAQAAAADATGDAELETGGSKEQPPEVAS